MYIRVFKEIIPVETTSADQLVNDYHGSQIYYDNATKTSFFFAIEWKVDKYVPNLGDRNWGHSEIIVIETLDYEVCFRLGDVRSIERLKNKDRQIRFELIAGSSYSFNCGNYQQQIKLFAVIFKKLYGIQIDDQLEAKEK